MKKTLFSFLLLFASLFSFGQKLESFQFNLYTDSLKKGFYNYINVDGQFSDGTWLPLDSTTLLFTANTGFFRGNDLFIDSSYQKDSVRIKVSLKANPTLFKEVTIYIRKRGFDEPLKTSDNEWNAAERAGKRRKMGPSLTFS